MSHYYLVTRLAMVAALLLAAIAKLASEYTSNDYLLTQEWYTAIAIVELITAMAMLFLMPRAVFVVATLIAVASLIAVLVPLFVSGKKCGCLGAEAQLGKYGGVLLASATGLLSTLLGYLARGQLLHGAWFIRSIDAPRHEILGNRQRI